MPYVSKGYVLSQKDSPQNFLERSIEVQGIAGIDLKTVATTTVFNTVTGQGRFCPTMLILVVTAVVAMTVQPIITFMGSDYTPNMTAVNDYNIFTVGSDPRAIVGISTLIAEGGAVQFTVKAGATATTFTAQAFVRGFYTGL